MTLDSLIFVDAAEVSGVHEEAQEDPVFPLGSIGLQLSPIYIYLLHPEIEKKTLISQLEIQIATRGVKYSIAYACIEPPEQEMMS